MQHLDQNGLAQRWLISPRTLEQWRWQGRGPRFLKIGGRVIYPVPEVEAYEAASLHANTVGSLGDDPEAEVVAESVDASQDRSADRS